MENKNYNTIDEYILTCDKKIQKTLVELRSFIKKYAPEATEKISWKMPTFYLHGNLVHFCANKNHIGFYPSDTGIEKFEKEIKDCGYSYSKGAVQFPYDKPLPLELIKKIVEFRVEENITNKKQNNIK